MNDKPLETLLEEKELAETLQVSIGTLRTWRTDGKGPRFHRIGQMIRYAPSDVKEWLLSRQAGGGMAAVARCPRPSRPTTCCRPRQRSSPPCSNSVSAALNTS